MNERLVGKPKAKLKNRALRDFEKRKKNIYIYIIFFQLSCPPMSCSVTEELMTASMSG